MGSYFDDEISKQLEPFISIAELRSHAFEAVLLSAGHAQEPYLPVFLKRLPRFIRTWTARVKLIYQGSRDFDLVDVKVHPTHR